MTLMLVNLNKNKNRNWSKKKVIHVFIMAGVIGDYTVDSLFFMQILKSVIQRFSIKSLEQKIGNAKILS